jgi:DNA-directed RNA polymerase specialized sigma24 family protein
VTTWLGRLQAGDAAAATPLWQRYYSQMVQLARGHLSHSVRPSSDEEDVALSAFTAFCAAVKIGRFPNLDDRNDLWRLLFTLTLHKARDQVRYETRDRRDVRRRAVPDLLGLPEADLDRLAGDSPDPALAAEVADQLRHLLTLLPGDDLRAVARDLLEGYTAPEIALRQGCSLSTIERRWRRVRQFWQDQQAGP